MSMVISGTSGVTFPDASTQTTAANTALVLSATAGASAGAVGTYAFMQSQNIASPQDIGFTLAGSGLRYAHVDSGSTSPTVPSGTWRLMGYMGSNYAKTIWLRIS